MNTAVNEVFALEAAWSAGELQVIISHGKNSETEKVIDFEKMEEYDSTTHSSREVRREDYMARSQGRCSVLIVSQINSNKRGCDKHQFEIRIPHRLKYWVSSKIKFDQQSLLGGSFWMDEVGVAQGSNLYELYRRTRVKTYCVLS